MVPFDPSGQRTLRPLISKVMVIPIYAVARMVIWESVTAGMYHDVTPRNPLRTLRPQVYKCRNDASAFVPDRGLHRGCRRSGGPIRSTDVQPRHSTDHVGYLLPLPWSRQRRA